MKNELTLFKEQQISSLIRAINGVDLDVELEILPPDVQDAIQTIRSQRHTVLILSAKQIMEAAEFAGLEVFADPDCDELEDEYCIRQGMIAGSSEAGLEPYTGYLIESAEYPEDGAVPLSGEQPFVDYEQVIDEGFLRSAANCNGWPGELARRLLAMSPCEPLAWCFANNLTGMPAITVYKSVADSWRDKGWDITALYEHPKVQDMEIAAVETLKQSGYTWNGGQLWKPPLGRAPAYIIKDAIVAIGQWLVGSDTGLSSKTLAAIFLGATDGPECRFNYPLDPSDFGRCWRLVEAVPEIRDAFPRICQVYPPMAPFINNWDELSALYVTAVKSGTGKAPELYQRMKELRAEIE